MTKRVFLCSELKSYSSRIQRHKNKTGICLFFKKEAKKNELKNNYWL